MGAFIGYIKDSLKVTCVHLYYIDYMIQKYDLNGRFGLKYFENFRKFGFSSQLWGMLVGCSPECVVFSKYFNPNRPFWTSHHVFYEWEGQQIVV